MNRIYGLAPDYEPGPGEGIEYFHPEDQPTIREAYERAVEEGESYDLELRVVDGEGTITWVRTRGEPHIEDEEIVRVRGTIQDITERKEREQRIQELNERFELAVEGAELGVWDWDMTTDAVEFNEQWARMLGYSIEEIEPHLDAWEKRVHPDDLDQVQTALDAHIAGEVDYYDTEHRMRTANGDWKWIRDIGKIVERDEDGEPVRAVGIHVDVDARKTYQRTLEEERDMFTQGPAVVFRWKDEEGWPVEYVSDNVRDVFGYRPSELQSGEIAYEDLVHEDDLDRVSQEVAEHSDEGTERFSHEPYRIVTPEGDVRWVMDHTKNIWEDGEITHRLGYLIDITERREKEIYLKKAQQVGDIGWWRKEIPSDQIHWSERVSDLWGVDDDIGPIDHETFLEYIHSEDADDVDQAWQAALDGEPYDIEHRIITDDGEVKWMRETAEFTFGDEGNPVEAVGIVQDITERKEREQMLERQNTFLDYTSDIILVLDETGVVQYQSGQNPHSTEPEFPDLVGKRPAESVVHPDDVERVQEAFATLLESPGQTDTTEFRIETSDGDWRWVENRAQNHLDNPDVGGILVSSRDVTDRKEHEQKLRQFREAVEQTGHAVYITDTEGTIEYINPAFEDLTGYSEDDAFGRTPRILKSGEYDNDYYETFWETLNSGERWEDEIVDERADGEQIVLHQTVSPITDDDGEPQKFVAVAQDITQRKEYERQLEAQRDNLEILNQVVRHDIRNDLQLVLAYAETLDEYVEEGGEEYVEQVLEAGRAAVDITETARDVTAVMLQSDVDRSPIRLRHVLEKEVDDLRSEYEHAFVALEGSIPDVDVLADDMLESVFRNLLSNAVQHNDKEIPKVTVSATEADEHVTVRIADNGPGIPDDRKNKIFEQGEMGLDSEGTGLGLYLVETLVDRYGGDVRVEDNDPDGAVFLVKLPIAE